MLIKYIKIFLWRVAKRLSYIEDERCLKVNRSDRGVDQGVNKKTTRRLKKSVYENNLESCDVHVKYVMLCVSTFMQAVYNYMLATNRVSRVYCVAAILQLQLMVHAMLFPMLTVLYFNISTCRSACVQRPMWLFSVVP